MVTKFKTTIAQDIRDYVIITIGLIMYAMGFTCFQLPYEITTGGLAGAAAVIFYATGFPVQYTFFAVNILLLCVAVKVLGWRFCLKTIYAVFMLTFLLGIVQEIMIHLGETHPDMFHVINPHSKLPQVVQGNAFMSCILGAAIEGVGIGFVFLHNGSTGGTDIIASIINKYKDVTLGQMMMLCDIIIITTAFFLPSCSTATARSSLSTSCSTMWLTVVASRFSSLYSRVNTTTLQRPLVPHTAV